MTRQAGVTYFVYFRLGVEAMEKPKEVLHEEVLGQPGLFGGGTGGDCDQAHILGQIGAILAMANQGEVLALHIVRVPSQLTLVKAGFS